METAVTRTSIDDPLAELAVGGFLSTEMTGAVV